MTFLPSKSELENEKVKRKKKKHRKRGWEKENQKICKHSFLFRPFFRLYLYDRKPLGVGKKGPISRLWKVFFFFFFERAKANKKKSRVHYESRSRNKTSGERTAQREREKEEPTSPAGTQQHPAAIVFSFYWLFFFLLSFIFPYISRNSRNENFWVPKKKNKKTFHRNKKLVIFQGFEIFIRPYPYEIVMDTEWWLGNHRPIHSSVRRVPILQVSGVVFRTNISREL